MVNIVLAFALVVVIIGMVRFKKLTVPFKLLVIWLVIDFILDFSNPYIIKIYKNNARLSHVTCILEYMFYGLIYYQLFISKKVKRLILCSMALFFIFFIINAIFLQPFTRVFPTNANMSAEVFYVLFAFLLFKQMLQYPVQINIMRQSIFWFNTGLLFFSTTMFLNLSLMNYYSKYHQENLSLIVFFWYSIDIITSIIFGIALLNDKKESIETNG